MSDYEDRPSSLISRRQFLKSLAIAASASAGYAILSHKPSSLNSTPIPTPTLKPPEMEIKSTVEAVKQNSENTSFTEDPPFDKEFFKKVASSTFLLETYKDNMLGFATAWCVKTSDNSIYMVTNKHVLDENHDSIYVSQLGDNNFEDKHKVDNMIYRLHPERDIALFKFNTSNLLSKTPALKYANNYDLDSSTKALMVGYPGEFIDNNLVAGTIVKDCRFMTPNNEWLFPGVSMQGASGSPVVIYGDTGEPIVIGVHDLISPLDPDGESEDYQTENYIFVAKLDLEPLFKQIDEDKF